MSQKKLEYFVEKNLRHRPRFFAYIRPQEAALFVTYKRYIKKTVLDFGCGDGFFAETVFGKGYIDIGLDVRTSRIQQAINTGIYKKTVIYDGARIPFRDKSIHTIISNCVFEHIPHIKKSLHEMYRILKPGGYLLTSVMCSSWNDNLSGKTFGGSAYVNWFNTVQAHNSLFSKKKWMRTFTQTGFDIVHTDDYLFRNASVETERYHFLSLYSLILYRLTGRWTFGVKPNKSLVRNIAKFIREDRQNPSACFVVLKRRS